MKTTINYPVQLRVKLLILIVVIGSRIEKLDTFKCLRVYLDKKTNLDAELKARIENASKLYYSFIRKNEVCIKAEISVLPVVDLHKLINID